MTREEQIRKAADDYCGDDTREQSPCFYAHIHNAFLEGVAWADSHPQWIPVEERLPEENGKTQQSISVWATDGLMSGEFRYNFDTKTWTDMWGDAFDITHWMLLPQPPRKEEEQ